MKLQLYINGSLFNELALPDEEFENNEDVSFQDNVDVKNERMQVYIDQVKSMFFKKLCKAESFEIYLVADSKMNQIIYEDNLLEYDYR